MRNSHSARHQRTPYIQCTQYRFRSRGRTRDGGRTPPRTVCRSWNSASNGASLARSRPAVREKVAHSDYPRMMTSNDANDATDIVFFDVPVERRSGSGRHPVQFVDLGIPRPMVPASPALDPPFGRKSLTQNHPRNPRNTPRVALAYYYRDVPMGLAITFNLEISR